MNRDKAKALGTWLKIHTNISHFMIVYPETIKFNLIITLKEFNFRFFKIDDPWKDFTAVTKLIKRFNSVHVLGDDCNNKVFCSEKVLKK